MSLIDVGKDIVLSLSCKDDSLVETSADIQEMISKINELTSDYGYKVVNSEEELVAQKYFYFRHKFYDGQGWLDSNKDFIEDTDVSSN